MLRPGWFFIVAGIVAAAGILSWLFPLHRAIEVNDATVTEGAVQPTVLALGTVVAPDGDGGRRRAHPAAAPRELPSLPDLHLDDSADAFAQSEVGWESDSKRFSDVTVATGLADGTGAPVVGRSTRPTAQSDEPGSCMPDVKPD